MKRHPECVALMCGKTDCGKRGPCYVAFGIASDSGGSVPETSAPEPTEFPEWDLRSIPIPEDVERAIVTPHSHEALREGTPGTIYAGQPINRPLWLIWKRRPLSNMPDAAMDYPVLCDNNLSGLPFDFQQFILETYVDSGVELKDCNSGFEPMSFTEDMYVLWRFMFNGPWRFAFDEWKEYVDVWRMLRILRRESPRRKQVYVLIGNEPVAACFDRAMQVIAWGGEPYVQARMRLNTLSRDELWLSDDWTPTAARDMQRYFNRHLWRSLPIADYKPRVNEPPPFRGLPHD